MSEGDDFSATSLLEVKVSPSSMRSARSDIEEGLGDITVDVDASASGQLASSAGGGGRMAGKERAMSRQLLDQSNKHLNTATDHLDDNLTLNETRNDLLREMLDVQEAAAEQGGGGSSLRPRPRSISGGLVGGGLLIAGILGSQLSSVNWTQTIADAIPNIMPSDVVDPATLSASVTSVSASSVLSTVAVSKVLSTSAVSSVLSSVTASKVLSTVAASSVLSSVAASAVLTSVAASAVLNAVDVTSVLNAKDVTSVLNAKSVTNVLNAAAASKVLTAVAVTSVLNAKAVSSVFTAVSLSKLVTPVAASELVTDSSGEGSGSGDGSGSGSGSGLPGPLELLGATGAGLTAGALSGSSALSGSGIVSTLFGGGSFASATSGSVTAAGASTAGLSLAGILGTAYGTKELNEIANGGEGVGWARNGGQNFAESNPDQANTIRSAFTNNPIYGAGQWVGEQTSGGGDSGGQRNQSINFTIDNTTRIDGDTTDVDVEGTVDRKLQEFERGLRREFDI